jgi:hypothetical protein
MSLKFETRCNLCISLPVDCHKSQLRSVLPLLKPSATNWRSACTSPRVHNWAPLRPTIANCLSFFFFLLSDPTLLSCRGCGARWWSLLAERKGKYVKVKIIVLKRGRGLGGKANFLSSSDQLVGALCTGQRMAFGNSWSYSNSSEGVHRVVCEVLQFGVLSRSGRSVRVLQVECT